MKINSHCWLRIALQRLQCIFIILWKYSNKRRTGAAALIRGRRLLTIPLHVRRLIEGGAYSSKYGNYGIKYTSCQLQFFQKTNLKVKISEISMKFDPRITWVKFNPSREHVFVYARLHTHSCHVFSIKIGRKKHTESFPK